MRVLSRLRSFRDYVNSSVVSNACILQDWAWVRILAKVPKEGYFLINSDEDKKWGILYFWANPVTALHKKKSTHKIIWNLVTHSLYLASSTWSMLWPVIGWYYTRNQCRWTLCLHTGYVYGMCAIYYIYGMLDDVCRHCIVYLYSPDSLPTYL